MDTRELVKICEDAGCAGADFAIAIAPGFYARTVGQARPSLKKYFVDIAEASHSSGCLLFTNWVLKRMKY